VTAAPLLVRWIAGDATRVRAALAAAFGVDLAPGRSIAIPGMRLEIAEGEPGRGRWAPDRLEVLPPDPGFDTDPNADDATAAAARFLALGWATVDPDRVAATWPGVRWVAVPRDSLVGARALLGRPDVAGRDATGADVAGPDVARPDVSGGGASGAGVAQPGLPITMVLLDPDTEGRLAAALARHAEGPAAIYVGMSGALAAGVRIRLARLGVRVSAGPGPFGPQMALTWAPASGPTLVIVPARDPDVAGGPAPGGRGTIRP